MVISRYFLASEITVQATIFLFFLVEDHFSYSVVTSTDSFFVFIMIMIFFGYLSMLVQTLARQDREQQGEETYQSTNISETRQRTAG